MDDPAQCLADAFAYLQEGASDPGSPFRNPALATAPASPTAPPGLRTVVLRRFTRDARIVELHTDARSPKIAQLRQNPFAALHVWDPARRIQLRLDGAVAIAGTEKATAAWAALPPASRATYAVSLAPGTAIDDPARATPDLPEHAARQNFAVLELSIDVLEDLSLARGSHRRARFCWPGNRLAATWLVP
jgi:pyridoxamine 5'-phosphate oxidase